MSDLKGSESARPGKVPDPDPHGQAALLLVESLLHGLIERSVIRTQDAIEIVAIAAEVKVEVARSSIESSQVAERSLHLLNAIAESLGHDLPPDTTPGPRS